MRENRSVSSPARIFSSWPAVGFFPLLIQLALGLMALSFAPPAKAVVPVDISIQTPQIGDHALHILSSNLLELVLINTESPNSSVSPWNWVNNQQLFVAPRAGGVEVIVDGQLDPIIGMGFKRRPVYAPLLNWDLRIGNQLYLQLSNSIPNAASVKVLNNGSVWPSTLVFSSSADPLRFNPAIHVNQEGYMPGYPKVAVVGYYLGDMGEMQIPSTKFELIEAASGNKVFEGSLNPRKDVGYLYLPAPYQAVFQADFTAFNTPGEYRVSVPGMGASLPFHIDEGIAMDFARTYELGIFHQRGGYDVNMPFTRFTHAADPLAPALVPTNASALFAFTWRTVSNYCTQINPDNPPQVAPAMTNYAAQLFPFVNQGAVSVSGGHFEAGDYNRVTYNAAQVKIGRAWCRDR